MQKRKHQKRHTGKSRQAEVEEFIRLNKFIAESGYCSRRKADELISEGIVKVNGKRIIDLGTKGRYSDDVTIKGDHIKSEVNLVYILLNKPKDTITTTNDEMDRKTVLDIVRKKERIYPVGRLDRNTTGALLLTNDGELAYRLTHPKFNVLRKYTVTLDKQLISKDASQIANGIEIDDEKFAPCELFIDVKDKTKVQINLTEGKNHEVKRLFEHLGYFVKKLDRKEFAGLSTKGLSRGQFRNLTNKEVLDIKRANY